MLYSVSYLTLKLCKSFLMRVMTGTCLFLHTLDMRSFPVFRRTISLSHRVKCIYLRRKRECTMLYVQRFFSLAIHCTLLAVFFFPSLTGSLYGYKSLSTYHSAYHSAFSPVASARIDPRSLMQKATHFLEASCEIGLSNIEAAGPETSQSTSMQSTSMQSAAINPPLPVLKNALHFIEIIKC